MSVEPFLPQRVGTQCSDFKTQTFEEKKSFQLVAFPHVKLAATDPEARMVGEKSCRVYERDYAIREMQPRAPAAPSAAVGSEEKEKLGVYFIAKR